MVRLLAHRRLADHLVGFGIDQADRAVGGIERDGEAAGGCATCGGRQQQAGGEGGYDPNAQGGYDAGAQGQPKDDVVDADYEVVDDK